MIIPTAPNQGDKVICWYTSFTFYIFPYYGKGSILCSLGEFLSLDAFLGCEICGLAIPRHIMCILTCPSRSVAGNVRARILIYRIIIE